MISYTMNVGRLRTASLSLAALTGFLRLEKHKSVLFEVIFVFRLLRYYFRLSFNGPALSHSNTDIGVYSSTERDIFVTIS